MKFSAVSFWSNTKHSYLGNSWSLGLGKLSHNDLLLGMESLMIHNSNHDANNNDKSWSDDELKIESNGLCMKQMKQFMVSREINMKKEENNLDSMWQSHSPGNFSRVLC